MEKRLVRIGIAIVWVLSIFIITVGVYNFVVSAFIAYSLSNMFVGLSDITAGLIIFPPFDIFLKKKFKISMPICVRGVLFFLLFAISNGIYLVSNYLS